MNKTVKWQGLIALLCLLITCLLLGCKVMDDQQREDRLKELLKDKYGEEFEVRDMYVNSAVKAYCYPVNNPDIIFKVDTTLEMDSISMDYYLQRLVCAQLEEELQPQIEEIYPGCYVSIHIDTASTTNYKSYIEDGVTPKLLEDYFRKEGLSDSITLHLFLDREKASSEYYVSEWEQLNSIMISVSDEIGNPNFHIYIYGCDSYEITRLEKIIKERNWDSSGDLDLDDIYDEIDDKKPIWIMIDHNKDSYIIDEGYNKIDFEEDIYKEYRRDL